LPPLPHVNLSRFYPITQALDLMAGNESSLSAPPLPFPAWLANATALQMAMTSLAGIHLRVAFYPYHRPVA